MMQCGILAAATREGWEGDLDEKGFIQPREIACCLDTANISKRLQLAPQLSLFVERTLSYFIPSNHQVRIDQASTRPSSWQLMSGYFVCAGRCIRIDTGRYSKLNKPEPRRKSLQASTEIKFSEKDEANLLGRRSRIVKKGNTLIYAPFLNSSAQVREGKGFSIVPPVSSTAFYYCVHTCDRELPFVYFLVALWCLLDSMFCILITYCSVTEIWIHWVEVPYS